DAETRQMVEEIVYQPLTAIHGSVSAEHGVGLEKKPYLHWCRNENEIALMRLLKRSMDPKGILNPGKVLDVVV
ncbi:MAG: FAD-binding oxidoreductase, partial [Gammaproteobacteria bacterium]|nr:FAD-binding oxidoreductase [Gammaproteobacteria bacterium]